MWKKGHLVSKETRKKISEANSGIKNGMYRGGKPHCKECGVELWWGSTYCYKHAKSGDRNPNKKKENSEKISIALKKRFETEENHPRWKGDSVGYVSLHKWVKKHLGKPNHCEMCGTIEDRKYHWANVSKKYLRKLDDWVSLCVPCHHIYDIKNKKC